MPAPRPVVHCIFRHHGHVLLTRIVDRLTGEVAWRLPGGGIEWSETAEHTLRREMREELGIELASLRYRATLDGMIHWNGVDEHELVLLYDAVPVDWAALEQERVTGIEANGRPLDLRWVAPAEIVARGERFYPEGIAAHIAGVRTNQSIRSVALCVFRRGDSVLVFEAWDAVKQHGFRRFPGGGIEFGESAETAIRREMREELGTELVDVRRLGILENLFTYEGQPGHEVVFVFEAAFEDPLRYDSLDEFRLADDGGWVDCSWVPITELDDPAAPLVPEGTLGLL